MARVNLGVNASFAATRYPEPDVWLHIVGRKLNLRYTQFFSDLIDPKVEEQTRYRMCMETRKAAEKHNVTIHSVFSGTAPHWCHFLLHPDEGMRQDAVRWYENYIRMTPWLGAKGVGSLLGAYSVHDMEQPERKEYLLKNLIDTWHKLSKLAHEVGVEYLMFEPMSVPREIPYTMEETELLYEKLNHKSAVPVKLCMDVGHGAAVSGSEEDRDPYAWIHRFAARTPVIHIQQTDGISSKHWPFTEEYNKRGIIFPGKVLEAIEKSGADEVLLVLEIVHPFFEPMGTKVIDDLQYSVEYWRKYLD